MALSARIGYARVSTSDQNLARQLAKFEALSLDRVFTDTISGKNLERPGFKQMMDYVRDGDELYICSMDRLARNLKDLLSTTQTLQEKGVSVHFLKENISLKAGGENSPITNLLMAMMGAVAEFERSLILERQREGIAQAKSRGKYKGRQPISQEVIAEARKRLDSGVTMTRISKDLNVGRTTLYKYLKQQTARDQDHGEVIQTEKTI